MRKIILSIALLLSVSACTNYKTQNIVTLTNSLYVANDYKESITLSKKVSFQKAGSSLNNVHLSQKDLSEKMKFVKLKLPHKISAEPLIIDDRIYVLCSNGSLFAFDKNTYKQLWKTYISDKRVKTLYQGGGIAHDKGKLYVTNGSQNLVILNAENGRRYTVKNFSDILNHPPIISDNRVYILTLGNQLFALDKGSLVLVWDHSGHSESITYGKNKSYLALDPKNRVFVSYPSGKTFMLDPKDGSTIWDLHFASSEIGAKYIPSNIVAEPIFDRDYLYIADAVGKLHKFNLKDNSKVWEVKVSDIQSLNKSGSALFVTNNRRQAAAISAKNGKVLWVTDLVGDVDAYLKSEQKAKQIAEENEMARKEASSAEASKDNKPTDLGWLSKLKDKFSSKNSNQKVHISNRKPILGYEYDVNKQKPLSVTKSLIMNDDFVIYTEKGLVYYISVEDGSLISQRRIKQKYSYITFGDSIIFSHNDKLFFEK